MAEEDPALMDNSDYLFIFNTIKAEETAPGTLLSALNDGLIVRALRRLTGNEEKKIYVYLFDNFTALDVFGPVEVLSGLGNVKIEYVSLNGEVISNSQGIRIETIPADEVTYADILLIPGGFGTRTIINDRDFINSLAETAKRSNYVLTVCTGSALRAEAGILDGKKATSNKRAFRWATDSHTNTDWNREARWVRDGNIYTSRGVSAGIDMALGFVTDMYGRKKADEIASRIEYHRNMDADHDIF